MFYIIYSQYFLKTEKNRSKTLKPKNKNICSLHATLWKNYYDLGEATR